MGYLDFLGSPLCSSHYPAATIFRPCTLFHFHSGIHLQPSDLATCQVFCCMVVFLWLRYPPNHHCDAWILSTQGDLAQMDFLPDLHLYCSNLGGTQIQPYTMNELLTSILRKFSGFKNEAGADSRKRATVVADEERKAARRIPHIKPREVFVLIPVVPIWFPSIV